MKKFTQQHTDGTLLILQHHSHFTRSSKPRACLDTSVEDFHAAKLKFLDTLIENIQTRFPSAPLISAMKMFSPSAYPSSKEALSDFADSEFETLLQHFGSKKGDFSPYTDSDSARTEFPMFKKTMFRYITAYMTTHEDPPSPADATDASPLQQNHRKSRMLSRDLQIICCLPCHHHRQC